MLLFPRLSMSNLLHHNSLECFGPSQAYRLTGWGTRVGPAVSGPTADSIHQSEAWGAKSPFKKTFIIRGIGYRATLISNTWQLELQNAVETRPYLDDKLKYFQLSDPSQISWSGVSRYEFPYGRYLSLRLGHSYTVSFPVPSLIGVRSLSKGRKLVLYSSCSDLVSSFSRLVFFARPPSVYTGRGVRYKGIYHRRKLGKKDIRKGRFF